MKIIETRFGKMLKCDDEEYEIVKDYLRIFDNKNLHDERQESDRKTIISRFEQWSNSQSRETVIQLIIFIEREAPKKHANNR